MVAFLLFYWCVGGSIAAVVMFENSGRHRPEPEPDKGNGFGSDALALLSLVEDDD